MRSMTGYAKTRHEHPEASIEIEIRSVNNRHLKISTGLTGLPLAHEDQVQLRLRSAFAVSRFSWIAGAPPSNSDMHVKLRHGPDIVECQLTCGSESGWVQLAQPDPGIAAGQHAVFYDGEVCLGGGIIR